MRRREKREREVEEVWRKRLKRRKEGREVESKNAVWKEGRVKKKKSRRWNELLKIYTHGGCVTRNECHEIYIHLVAAAANSSPVFTDIFHTMFPNLKKT